MSAKPKLAAAGKPEASRRSPRRAPKPKAQSLTLTEADPDELVVGGEWTEVKLIGTGLKTKGLKAFVIHAIRASKDEKSEKSKVKEDKKVLIEQPEEDAIRDKEFPIVAKALADADEGDRNVVLARSLGDLDAFGNCNSKDHCVVLKNGIKLI
jgi:hypothetical protein